MFPEKQFVFWARGFSFPFSPNKNMESKHAWRRKMKTVGNVPVETVRFLNLNGCHELTIIHEDPTTHICTNCVVSMYLKLLFRMRRSVSSGVLSYLTPRFAWRFCCLDLPPGCRCEQSNQTYSNCTGLEFICLRGPLTVEQVFD